MFKNKKLKSLVNTLLLVSAVIPCIIFILVSSNSLKGEADLRFRSDIRRVLGSLAQTTKNYDSLLSSAYLFVESDENLVNKLSNTESFAGVASNIEDVKALIGDSLVDIGIYSMKTNQLMDSEGNITTGDVTSEEWYTQALVDQNKLIEVETVLEDGKINVTFVKTLYETIELPENKTKKNTIGMMYLTLDFNEVVTVAQNVLITANTNVLILDKDNRILFDRENKLVGKTVLDEPWLYDVLASKNKSFVDNTINGEDYLVYKEVSNSSGVAIVALVPESDINASILKTMKPTIIFAIFIIVVVLVTGYVFIKIITKPFGEIVENIEPFKHGDFSEKIEVKDTYPEEMKYIVYALNDVSEGISTIIDGIKSASGVVESNSTTLTDITENSYCIVEGIVAASHNISNETEMNVFKTKELVQVVDDLSSEIETVRDLSEDILSSSERVSLLSEKGKGSINNLKKSFEENNQITTEVVDNIKQVANVSKEINNITNSIRAITKQTNMLSLNASIEASKAGDAGRGFSVVANQIRTLSEQSESSTKEIDSYIESISKTIQMLEAKVQTLTSTNEATYKVVDITYDAFLKITSAVNELNSKINVIGKSISTIEEKKGTVSKTLENVNESTKTISESTQEVSLSMQEQSAQLEEITATSAQLSSLVAELKNLLGQFKVADNPEDEEDDSYYLEEEVSSNE